MPTPPPRIGSQPAEAPPVVDYPIPTPPSPTPAPTLPPIPAMPLPAPPMTENTGKSLALVFVIVSLPFRRRGVRQRDVAALTVVCNGPGSQVKLS